MSGTRTTKADTLAEGLRLCSPLTSRRLGRSLSSRWSDRCLDDEPNPHQTQTHRGPCREVERQAYSTQGFQQGYWVLLRKVRVLVNLVRLFRAPTEGLIGLATGTCFGSVPNSVGLSVQVLGWAAPPRGSARGSDCPSKWEQLSIKPGKVDQHSDVQSREAKE